MADDAPHMRDEAVLRQWVKVNPGRVKEMLEGRSSPDSECTVLFAAVSHLNSLPLTVWLLNEKDTDVNAFADVNEWTPLHVASSLEIGIALMDRGADPVRLDGAHWTPLMRFMYEG